MFRKKNKNNFYEEDNALLMECMEGSGINGRRIAGYDFFHTFHQKSVVFR